MTCGIYCINCNGRPYVGQSINIEARWKKHIRLMKRNAHPNRLLQRIWNKHGATAFLYSILEECDPQNLTEREQFWYDKLNSFERGCNLAPIADSPTRGRGHTDKTKAKISMLNQGKPNWARKFTEEEITAVWLRYMNGESAASIAATYGVDSGTVGRIVSRLTYPEVQLPPSCRKKQFYRKGGGRKKRQVDIAKEN